MGKKHERPLEWQEVPKKVEDFEGIRQNVDKASSLLNKHLNQFVI